MKASLKQLHSKEEIIQRSKAWPPNQRNGQLKCSTLWLHPLASYQNPSIIIQTIVSGRNLNANLWVDNVFCFWRTKLQPLLFFSVSILYWSELLWEIIVWKARSKFAQEMIFLIFFREDMEARYYQILISIKCWCILNSLLAIAVCVSCSVFQSLSPLVKSLRRRGLLKGPWKFCRSGFFLFSK